MDERAALRFWSKVDKSGECWVWKASLTSTGYGAFSVGGRGGRMEKAHRAAWVLTHGPIPVGNDVHGTCVLHRCDNRRCVNPAHLFLGTQTENLADMRGKDRGACGDDISTRLTESVVRQVRAAAASGESLRSIGRRIGVAHQTLSIAVRRKTWAHVD